MCKSKDCGGLGIINLEICNKSLLIKWKWRIVNDNSTISRGIIMHRYKNLEVKIFISDVCVINQDNLSGNT